MFKASRTAVPAAQTRGFPKETQQKREQANCIVKQLQVIDDQEMFLPA